MKIVYIAHEISGDVKGNLQKIRDISVQINKEESNVIPFTPYMTDCISLDDDNPYDRARAIRNNTNLILRGFIDEIRIYGNIISPDMIIEIDIAQTVGIHVSPMNEDTGKEFREMFCKSKYTS